MRDEIFENIAKLLVKIFAVTIAIESF